VEQSVEQSEQIEDHQLTSIKYCLQEVSFAKRSKANVTASESSRRKCTIMVHFLLEHSDAVILTFDLLANDTTSGSVVR